MFRRSSKSSFSFSGKNKAANEEITPPSQNDNPVSESAVPKVTVPVPVPVLVEPSRGSCMNSIPSVHSGLNLLAYDFAAIKNNKVVPADTDIV